MKKTDTQIKLINAAEEIKEILRKHDIAAAIALHDVGHGENFIHLNTSYSCAYIYNDEGVRFYSKRENYVTKEEHIKKLEGTSNMLRMLTDLSALNFQMTEQLSTKFDTLTGAEHTPLKRTR